MRVQDSATNGEDLELAFGSQLEALQKAVKQICASHTSNECDKPWTTRAEANEWLVTWIEAFKGAYETPDDDAFSESVCAAMAGSETKFLVDHMAAMRNVIRDMVAQKVARGEIDAGMGAKPALPQVSEMT